MLLNLCNDWQKHSGGRDTGVIEAFCHGGGLKVASFIILLGPLVLFLALVLYYFAL